MSMIAKELNLELLFSQVCLAAMSQIIAIDMSFSQLLYNRGISNLLNYDAL